MTSALGQYDLRFELPLDQLIILSVVSVIAGLLAAITPARRAARLNPLEALQYDSPLARTSRSATSGRATGCRRSPKLSLRRLAPSSSARTASTALADFQPK